MKKTNDDLQAQLKKMLENVTKGRPYSELSPSDRDLVNHVKSDEEQVQARLSKLRMCWELLNRLVFSIFQLNLSSNRLA